MPWYQRILPVAQAMAHQQGYSGARWPRCVATDGWPRPCKIEPFVIWQQPHPIALAELCYQAHPDQQTLEKYRQIVFETAEFMASFPLWSGQRVRAPVAARAAQELHKPAETQNPAFELAYWWHGLELAQQWRLRLDLPRHDRWDHVRQHLSPLPMADGLYLAHERCPDTFEKFTADHPSMLFALGMLPPTPMVDVETMRRTLQHVMKVWKWREAVWGCDFAMVAMAAARLGEKQLAIDALMMDAPRNDYLANGHNYQTDTLPLYLPGNGALLSAVALMASCGAFPEEWNVRAEGFGRA